MLPLETEHWANTHPPSSGHTELFQEELLVLGWFENPFPLILNTANTTHENPGVVLSLLILGGEYGRTAFILGAESLEPWNHLKPRVLFLAFEDPNYPWFSQAFFEYVWVVKLCQTPKANWKVVVGAGKMDVRRSVNPTNPLAGCLSATDVGFELKLKMPSLRVHLVLADLGSFEWENPL